MSSYQATALNPRNQAIETVQMLDNYFAHHQYAVAFQDGSKYPENQVVCIHPNDLDAEDVRISYQNCFSVIYSTDDGYLYDGDTFRTLAEACVMFKIDMDSIR